MSKQLQETDHRVACDVCGRTMLQGETAEPYLTPSRERRLVCQLCAPRAQQEGWIREAVDPAIPAHPPRAREGRGLVRWIRRRRAGERPAMEALPELAAEQGNNQDRARASSPDGPVGLDMAEELRARSPRDPRHVRAVPTNAQLKIERALDLFNTSEHTRTVAGIARTLGAPLVNTSTSSTSAAEVLLTVAWELSWYQFAVDLSDPHHPVRMLGRGEELGELAEDAREWNAHARRDGSIAMGVPAPESPASEEPDQVL